MNAAQFVIDAFMYREGLVGTIAAAVLPAYINDLAATTEPGKRGKKMVRLRSAILDERVIEALEFRIKANEQKKGKA